MGVLSWLNVRPRTLIGASIVSIAAIGITTMAVAYEGNPTTELDLNDGAVWITKADKQWVGHFNAESRLLDGKLSAPTADYDILQDDDVVLVHDFGDNSIGQVDPAAMSLPTSAKLPVKAKVDYSGKTVAILDPEKGAVYVTPLEGLAGFDLAKAKPVLEKLGKGAALTVGHDGAVHVASRTRATLYTVPVSPEGAARKDDIEKLELPGVDKKSELSVTAVGERPVVLDRETGTVTIPGADAFTLEDPKDAQLAQDAADGDGVVIASRDALIRVPFDGSKPVVTETGASSGTPAAPVWLNGCAYGAWMGSGRFVRECLDDGFDMVTQIKEYEPGGELVFRVNRDVVMLNDVVKGGAWLASEDLAKVDNWDDLTPPKGDGVENPDPTTVQVPDPTPPDRGKDNTPPVANPDTFGVRAGASTILPVLDNDSDPDGDVLVASLLGKAPAGTTIQPVNDGTALQITVDPGVTSVDSFRYRVNDGRIGGTAETGVKIDVRPEGENKAPKQLRKIALPVETGSTITYNVLPDWIDPDGDNIYLENVVPAEGDTARFTADGRITYRAISGNVGPIEVAVTVSDGTASMVGVFQLEVYPQSSKPPLVTADHLVVREGQLGTVDPLANDLSASDEPLTLTQVSQVEGAEVVTDLTAGTFTFESGKAGTYYLDYKVMTSGTSPVNGIVRVDVLKPDAASTQPPVAVRDVALLPAGGDARVNVLANDSDPAGGVLVVQRVDVPENSDIAVSVVNHETLRVTDAGLGSSEATQVKVTYTISNGAKTAQGEVVVLPMPAPAKVEAPVAYPDEATVRVGDVVTVPVLDNDYHPNDLDMDVRDELSGDVDTALGTAFVSQGKYVRFQANDEPGDVRIEYTVVDDNRQRATETLTIHVAPVDVKNNNAPRPVTVEARTVAEAKTPLLIPLDGIDPDGDSVELLTIASTAQKGAVTKNSNGQLEYTAHPGMSGLDTFSYRVRDALGAVATGTIRIGIAPKQDANQNPFAVRDSLVVKPGRVVAAPVKANDSDPDGDPIDLVAGKDALILPKDSPITAEVVGNRVMVTAPDEELETSLQYTIEDARGARAQGVLQISVRADAPEQPPVARDDFVLAEDIDTETQQRTIDLVENDEDPDGDPTALTVEILSEDEAVRLSGTTATVTVTEDRRLVKYSVTDIDGHAAYAFIHVPGLADLRPQLDPTAEAAVVESGKPITLPLDEYVKAMDGKKVRLTSAESVSAAHDNGSSLVVDAQTLTYTSAARYSGKDAITFEVTDGQNAEDPDGRTSILSIPITVLPPSNEPPEMSGATVTVGAGDAEPGRVDLNGLATDIDEDPISFTPQSMPDGVTARVVDGVLEVEAEADAKGTTGDIVILADDGQPNPDFPEPTLASIAVTVTASTRPMPAAADDTFLRWNQGETRKVDVLGNDTNPFADDGEPLRVIGAELETGTADQAELDWDESGLTITPAADFHGRLVFRYTIQDQTGDSERTAEGRVHVTVQGAPDAPTKPRVSHVQSRQLTLSWDAPADNGAEITGYQVTAVKGDTSYAKTCAETTCVLEGLTNNVTYAFTVVAANSVGESDPSPVSQDGRPDVRPNTPAAPAVPGFGDGSLTVTWAQPKSEGSPVTSYTLEIQPAMPNGVAQMVVKDPSAGKITRTIEGLANGTEYRFRVRAHNLAPDPSEFSGWSAVNIPAKPPAAPGTPTATRQSSIGPTPGSIAVTWPAVTGAAAGGDAVDLYEVQAYLGGAPHGNPQRTSGTSAVFSLAASGSGYTFTVKAKNKAGWGAPSAASAPLRQFTSPTAPGTPQVAADPHDQQMAFSWAPATAEGADAIHYKYLVNGSGAGWVDVGPATSASVSGLSNGGTYTVQVQAYSVAAGENSEPSPSSAESAPFVPYGQPFAPRVSATLSGDRTKVTCSWDASGGANGYPISVQARFFDGAGWQNVGITGSRECASGYEKTGQVEVRVTADPGGSNSAAASATTRGPEPSGSVSYVPLSEANPNGTVRGCSTTCRYLLLTYSEVPSGTYNVSCQELDPNWREFSDETLHLAGSGSVRLRCAYGYSNDVRAVVSGPVTFTAP